MAGLENASQLLSGTELLVALIALGFVVGVLTGLFGIGGAFVVGPVLINLFMIDSSVVVGSSLCFTIGTGILGLRKHRQFGNVEWRSMIVIGAGAIAGTLVGHTVHHQVREMLGEQGTETFRSFINILFIVALTIVAVLISRPVKESKDHQAILQRVRLPPYIDLPAAKMTRVSLTGLALVGFLVGVLKGILGIGGGVFIVPLLILVVGLSSHQAVGTSLGAVLISSVVGTISYAQDGDVNYWVAGGLLIGSSVGILIGARLCMAFDATRLKRYFSWVIIAMVIMLCWDVGRTWWKSRAASAERPPAAVADGVRRGQESFQPTPETDEPEATTLAAGKR